LGVVHAALAQSFFEKLGKELLKEVAPTEKEDKQEKKEKEPTQGQAETDEKKPKQRDLIIGGVLDVLSGAGEVPYETERVIGESLALEGFARYGMPVENAELQRYVNLVGRAVARNSTRADIPYHFVVVQSPLYNAFACPGGIIFVSSQLVKSLRDEAELAAVLAHEVGHVSHKHALQSIKRAQFLSGVGKLTAAGMKGEKGEQFQGMIGDLQTVLFDRGLDKNMEYEADLAAMGTAYRTGYDPMGMIRVLEMLRRNESRAKKAGSWFSTHPPLRIRLERLRAQLAQYRDAQGLATLRLRFAEYRATLR
jgi:predicted Zn-dependent protease